MNLAITTVLVVLYVVQLVKVGPLITLPLSLQQNASLYTRNRSMDGRQSGNLRSEREAILVATNQQRVRKRLPILQQDARLMQAAQQYAERMVAKDQMSHTLDGLRLVDKANLVGYSFRQLSENIALNTRLDGRSVVIDQWMESKGHRKNLLTKDITDIGIGVAGPSKLNRYYYCQLFGAQQ